MIKLSGYDKRTFAYAFTFLTIAASADELPDSLPSAAKFVDADLAIPIFIPGRGGSEVSTIGKDIKAFEQRRFSALVANLAAIGWLLDHFNNAEYDKREELDTPQTRAINTAVTARRPWPEVREMLHSWGIRW